MAVATRYENVSTLADTNTFEGPGRFFPVLVGGSDTATLSLKIGSDVVISLKALAGTTATTMAPIKIGGGITITVAITGTTPAAYAVWEVR